MQNLSRSSGRGKAVAEIDREVLGYFSTRRWNEIGAVDGRRMYVQLCYLRVNASRMFSFRGQEASRRSDHAGCCEHAGCACISGYPNILENSCHRQKVRLTAKSDSQSI